MRGGTPRPRFQPDLVRGDDPEALNAEFAVQAQRWSLAFRCPDCVFRAPDGSCTVGWPNAALAAEPVRILDASGAPAFCKAFEPDGP